MSRILVVDDDPLLRSLLTTCLRGGGHDVVTAADGREAVEVLRSRERLDAVVTDHSMPGVGGLDVIRTAQRLDPTLPCVVVSGYAEQEVTVAAMAEGAIGFLPKPFSPQHLLLVVERAVERRRTAEEAARLRLVTPLLERFTLLLANTIEAKDVSTQRHCERLSELSGLVAARLGLSEAEGADIRLGACLHDVGKIAVPDELLRRPSAPTEEEWAVLRRHPIVGAALLESVEAWGEARRIVRHHHERYDGRGYPEGLRGRAIPVGARIVCVVDAFDVMTTGRPYARARSQEAAVEELMALRGAQFDPDCVEALLAVLAEPEVEVDALGRRDVGLRLVTGA